MQMKVDSEGSAVASMQKMSSKTDYVRGVFEDSTHYLKNRRVDIRIRREVVKSFADLVPWKRLLDVGCGDGSISLPLVAAASHATFLDLSSSMIERVRAQLSDEQHGMVHLRNENFMTALFELHSFDLIVSVGVMAHVDSPEQFVSKISSLLSPGGRAIIEFTDCRHAMGRASRFSSDLKEIFAPAKYKTNRLSFPQVAGIFERAGLKLSSVFRYANLPLPRVQRMFSSDVQYRMIKNMFGSVGMNRNAWLGNEYICLLTLAGETQQN